LSAEEKAEQERANQIRADKLAEEAKERGNKDRIAREKSEMKKEEDEKSARKEAAEKERIKAREVETKAELEAQVQKKKQEEEELAKAAAAKEQAVALDRQAAAAAAVLPANTAYGKLPEQNQHKGYLRVQDNTEHEQYAFIKFPVASLTPQMTITGAVLRLFKYSGSESDFVVRVSACSWKRDTITYTNSQKLPGEVATTGTAHFPEDNNAKVVAELDGPLIQKARLAGDHICLRISGGASANPVVIASEMSANGPVLSVDYKNNVAAEKEVPVLAKEVDLRDSNDVHQLDDGGVEYQELLTL